MEKEILFVETQRFRQWWIYVILFGMNAVFLLLTFRQLYLGEPFGDRPMSDKGLLIFTAFNLLLTMLFLSFRLDTKIKSDGIYVQCFPFHLKHKHYSWESVSKAYVRKYSPALEYGGWGIRYGFKSGTAYNISGNIGLQLEFNNGKKLLIGTKKPEELETVLKNIAQQQGY